MLPSMASISSSSPATVRVEKATSEFLIGPDWTLNIEICDAVNSNQTLAKDVVKAVKRRLQHKNPKVQLLALTLLETMVKNCGDYVHFQIAERNIPQEMVKIVRKKTDMHVRDKVLTLIASWHQAFGGSRGRYPQYYLAYEELRTDGVEFPRQLDAAPIFTPPVAHPIPRHPQPGYGMPSSSSTRLDEAMAADENLSLSSLTSMRDVLDLLADMLQAVDHNDRSAVKDEVIIDLVEQCRANQKKLMQLLGTTGDEELLGKGLELNDSLQSVLAKHDAIASGSPLPPEATNIPPIASGKPDSSLKSSEKPDSSLKSAGVSVPGATSNGTPSAPVVPANKGLIDEEDEEEDDFAQLARRHSKNRTAASQNTSIVKGDEAPPEAPSSTATSNALVPIDAPSSVRSKDQDIIDLLSITLSTATPTEQTQATPLHTPGHIPSTTPGATFSSEAYPGNPGLAFNSYVAPWAQPQPQPQPSFQSQSEHTPYPQFQPETQPQSQPQPQPQQQPQHQPQYQPQPQQQPQHQPQYQPQQQPQHQPQYQPQPQQQPQHQPQYKSLSQPASHAQTQFPAYPPPPWAATPGYYSNQSYVSRPFYTYSTPRPTSSSNSRPFQHESINGETQVNTSPTPAAGNPGQKPFIPSYRLFEDLNVFGNTDGRFKATSNASPSLSGSNNQNMVGGRK